MRKALLLLILLLCSSSAYAQLTTVTATVSDSSGTAYSFGSFTVNLVNTTNQQPLFGGNANFQQVYSGGLDTNGLLSISLPSVTVMTPSPGLQWKFFICANPLQIAAVFPKPALPCFTYTSTGTQISGSSVDLSSSMTPTVVPKAGQGGAGTFTTVTAKNINNIVFVSNGNPQGWAGATPDAWITSAAGGASGGNVVVDARGLTGNITFSSTATLGQDVALLLGSLVTVTCNVAPCISFKDQFTLIGSGNNSTVFQGAGVNGLSGPLFQSANIATRFFDLWIQGININNVNSATAGGTCLDLSNISRARIWNVGCQNAAVGYKVSGTIGAFYDEFLSSYCQSVTTCYVIGANGNSTRVVGGHASTSIGTCATIDTATDTRFQGFDCENFTTGFNIGGTSGAAGVSLYHIRLDTGTSGIIIGATSSLVQIEALYVTGLTTTITDNASDTIAEVNHSIYYSPNLNTKRLRYGTATTAQVQTYAENNNTLVIRDSGDTVYQDIDLRDVVLRRTIQSVETASPGGAASGQANIWDDSVTHSLSWNVNNIGTSSPTGAWQCTNVTPVTVNANVATDQNLMSCSVPAGTLNRVGRTLRIWLAGVYSTPAASTTAVVIKVKLGTLTLAAWTSTALAGIQATNDQFNVTGWSTTQTAGASAAFEVHGNMDVDLGVGNTVADSNFADVNTATVSPVDSTATQTLQVTIAFTVASASNSATQRQLILETVN